MRAPRASICEEREAEPGAIARCVLAGFPDQVAVRLDEGTLRCALVHNRRGVLARESVVHRARLITASEIREIESSDGERQVLLTLATAIKEEWLREFFPEAIEEKTEVTYDPSLRRVVGRTVTLFHDLVLAEKKSDRVPRAEAAAILAREVIAGTCPLKKWDHAIEQWIARLNFAVAVFPELELPPIGEGGSRLAHRAGLPERDELQGDQGTPGRAGPEIMAERRAAGRARPARAGADQIA